MGAAACVSDKKDAILYTSETAATRDSFEKLYVGRYSDMQQKKVRCMTAASLLKKADIVAKDIDVVILDAEGSDLTILGSLLRLQGFAPVFIRFSCCFGWEINGVSSELTRSMTALSARGYNIYLEGEDMLAVHESVAE